MRMSRFLSLIVLFSIVYSSVSAQNQQQPAPTPDAEKAKAAAELEKGALELLDQSITESATLKLPENRAVILAMAGDLYWSRDEKRGRELFRDAINNLVAVVNTPEEKTAPNPLPPQQFGRIEVFNLRRMILLNVAKYDANFALEALQTTRPADVAAELQNYFAPADEKTAPQTSMQKRNNFKAEQEIQLERTISAAIKDPQKLAKMVRESLSKGFSLEILQSVYTIVAQDEELGVKVMKEVFQKVMTADLLQKRSDMNFAINLLRNFSTAARAQPINPKSPTAKLKVDDVMIKDLAVKIADTLMDSTSFQDAYSFASVMPTLEKLLPERMAQLKQKQAALQKQAPENVRFTQAPSSMTNPDATPESLIADAAKADPRYRASMYRQAAERSLRNGDPEKTRALLQNQPESKDRNDAIAVLDRNLSQKQIEAGKIEEARKLIDRMPVGNEKARQIVQMAIASFKSNTKEGKDIANGLMEEAKQLVKDFPEDKDETDGLLIVAAGYATIDPARAFAMLNPVIEQANELIGASATLAKYNKQNQFFREDEIVMSNNMGSFGSKIFRYGAEIKLLAQADLGRTRGLIDQFRRGDVRLFAKMFIAQGILKSRMGFDSGYYTFISN